MRSVPASLLVVLAGLPLWACDCSSEAELPETVTIEEFEIERTQPPGTVEDGVLVVTAGTDVTLRWIITGPAGRVVLAAGDDVLGRFDGQAGGGTFADLCADGACATHEPGEVLYSLTAVGAGEDATSDTRSLALTVRAP